MTSIVQSANSWQNWSDAHKLRLRDALWRELRRSEQTPPDFDGWVWYVQGGRGSGKTRSGSEALAEIIKTTIISGDGDEDGDWGICAPTFGDARDICVEGPSGLRHPLAGYTDGPWRKAWNRSQGQLRLANGASLFADGADDGAPRVQGKNLRGLWADEVGMWKRWEKAWDESIAFAVRLDPAVIVATGTPKAGHGLVKRLIGGDPDKGIPAADRVTKMRMADNIANLSRVQVERLTARYGGTNLGRQELEGELLEEVEGALWTLTLIDKHRRHEAGPLARVIVGVDPQGSAENGTTGIVAAGITRGDCPCGSGNYPHAYVLDDASVSASPNGWARAAVTSFDLVRGDRIVGERNFGGDMVESTIRTVWAEAPIYMVNASRGKMQRAEPIAALYEQGRVHHVGTFGDLESEMVTWTQLESWSPNRLDALVWAITELGLSEWREASIHTYTATLPSRR